MMCEHHIMQGNSYIITKNAFLIISSALYSAFQHIGKFCETLETIKIAKARHMIRVISKNPIEEQITILETLRVNRDNKTSRPIIIILCDQIIRNSNA